MSPQDSHRELWIPKPSFTENRAMGGQAPGGETPEPVNGRYGATIRPRPIADVLSDSIIKIVNGRIESMRARSCEENEPRRRGTIARVVFTDRSKQTRDSLAFLNDFHGQGAVAPMR